MQVSFVQRASDVPDGLWEAGFSPPLEGRFWYQTLEASGLEEQFAFFYAIVSHGGRAVGLAPCFVHDVPITLVAPAPVAFFLRLLSGVFSRVGYQRTVFIGSPCADEGTIGLAEGVRLADVLGPLMVAVRDEARRRGASMIVLKDFRLADALVAAGAPGMEGFVRILSYPGCALPLPPGGKEAYYRSLSHNQRHNLLKKLRRSREALEVETSVVQRPSEDELREILGLFLQTYSRGKTKFERLGHPFFAAIREQPEATFLLLRDRGDGALVAFMLVFHLGDRVINKFIGLDYQRGERAFLYFRLFDAALEWTYARGARELQSGQTGYRAKADTGHRLVELCNLFQHRNPAVHAVFRLIGSRTTWASLDKEILFFREARGHAVGSCKRGAV